MNQTNEFEYFALPEKIVSASTHKEFLMKVFNCTKGTGRKSIWWYNDDIAVWMVCFEGVNDNWKNRTVKIDGKEYIREKYIGKEPNPTWNGKPITLNNVEGPLRLAVAIRKNAGTVTYNVLGLYLLDIELSEDLNRVYKKVDLNVAQIMIPEAFL